MTPSFETTPLLETPGIRHAFFSRSGGVSEGIYTSLNTGPGSDDLARHITENRSRCASALGCAEEKLVVNHQIHSSDVVIIDSDWSGERAKADGLVTQTPGLALGVLSADCMPWLFADPDAGVIGAAHAGWRGALAGVLENTVAAMENLGAKASNIRASLGPCLRQENFEVGFDLVEAFTSKYDEAGSFFSPGASDEKRQFDLAGFAVSRLQQIGVRQVEDVGACTLGESANYFSYRAARRRNEPDYGRNLSAIIISKN